MSALNPFDLVARLRNAPLEPLVETLRQLHDRGAVDPPSLEHVLGLSDGAPESPRPATVAAKPSGSNYEAARRHFVQYSERLREQAMLTEHLLDGLTGHASRTALMLLQHQLRVQCGPGETSAARFVVVNGLDQPADVRFRPGRVHGLSTEQAASVHISFEPDHPHLQAGAEREVQLQVDLRDADGLPDALELGVDVLGNEHMLLKLWVRIELRRGGAK
jgi:hypothetical protein